MDSEKKLLILGDEGLTFSLDYIHHLSRQEEAVHVGIGLTECQLTAVHQANIERLEAQGVTVLYGLNPALFKNFFQAKAEEKPTYEIPQYSRILFILPGLAYHGCPSFIDNQTELFRLRLNLFTFGFLKSVKTTVHPDCVIQLLWPYDPSQEGTAPAETSETPRPFADIDINKLGKFCKIARLPKLDLDLDLSQFKSWQPIIHSEKQDSVPPYLMHCRAYTFSTQESVKGQDNEKGHGDRSSCSDADREDYNVLKVPPQVFAYDRELLPHVNECFRFHLWARRSTSVLISKLTLKYDPRISGWKGGSNLPLKPKGGMGRGEGGPGSGVPPPPPFDSSSANGAMSGGSAKSGGESSAPVNGNPRMKRSGHPPGGGGGGGPPAKRPCITMDSAGANFSHTTSQPGMGKPNPFHFSTTNYRGDGAGSASYHDVSEVVPPLHSRIDIKTRVANSQIDGQDDYLSRPILPETFVALSVKTAQLPFGSLLKSKKTAPPNGVPPYFQCAPRPSYGGHMVQSQSFQASGHHPQNMQMSGVPGQVGSTTHMMGMRPGLMPMQRYGT